MGPRKHVFPVTQQVYDQEFYVDEILGHKKYRGKDYYLVKWIGYPVHESTWEPEKNLSKCPFFLEKWKAEIHNQNQVKIEQDGTSNDQDAISRPKKKRTKRSKKHNTEQSLAKFKKQLKKEMLRLIDQYL